MSDSGRAIKILQGYIWHPKNDPVELADYLPKNLDSDIHILWDKLERAPFSFFDDGTLADSQQLYQFTVLAILAATEPAAGLVKGVAETLQAKLETTPPTVGWQIFEDLRDV